MNIDQGLGLLAGALVTLILGIPTFLLIMRLVRGSGQTRSDLMEKAGSAQIDWAFEKEKAERLTELVNAANRKIKLLEKDADALRIGRDNAEKAKEKWHRRYESMLSRHNELVRKHNE